MDRRQLISADFAQYAELPRSEIMLSVVNSLIFMGTMAVVEVVDVVVLASYSRLFAITQRSMRYEGMQ